MFDHYLVFVSYLAVGPADTWWRWWWWWWCYCLVFPSPTTTGKVSKRQRIRIVTINLWRKVLTRFLTSSSFCGSLRIVKRKLRTRSRSQQRCRAQYLRNVRVTIQLLIPKQFKDHGGTLGGILPDLSYSTEDEIGNAVSRLQRMCYGN